MGALWAAVPLLAAVASGARRRWLWTSWILFAARALRS
jgi:hypothetical protein